MAADPERPARRTLATGAALDALVFLLLGAIFACGALVVFPLHLDDPYITFRYGKHLADGQGLTWNTGEPPVEGFTSLAWVVVAAASEKAGVFPLLTAKGLGILAALASLLVVAVFSRDLLPLRHERLLAGLLLATSSDLVSMSVSGMENVPFLALASLLVPLLGPLLSGRVPRVGPARAVAAGLLSAALCAIRPEGHLVALVLLALLAFESRGRSRRPLVLFSAVLLALVGPLHAFRLATFGGLLPLTYLAKHTGEPVLSASLSGLRYLGDRASAWAPVFVLAVGGGLSPGRRPAHRAVSVLLVAFLAYVVKVGGDSAAFPGVRLLLPVLPIAAAAGVAAARDAFPARGGRAAALAVLAFFFTSVQTHWLFVNRRGVTFQGASAGVDVRKILDEAEVHLGELLEPRRLHISGYLLRETPRGEAIAVPWAGRVPYETMLPTIDLLGLNDPHIARLAKRDAGVDVKYDAAYVLSRRPYFVCENFQLWNLRMADIGRLSEDELKRAGANRAGQRELLRSPVLLRDYEVDPDVPNTIGGSITCFRRKGHPSPS